MRLLLSLANAVGAGRKRQTMRELFKAYANGIDSRALDDVFEQFAWNMGIGFFSSEIAPSPLFKAYKTIKQTEKQGKSREEINQALREKFSDKTGKREKQLLMQHFYVSMDVAKRYFSTAAVAAV